MAATERRVDGPTASVDDLRGKARDDDPARSATTCEVIDAAARSA
jgi:hypothetical protein